MKKILRRYGNEFLKYHGPTVQEDWQQVVTLERLTNEIPEILTAKPLRFDLENEYIWYEWLGDMPSLMSLQGDELDEVVCRAGRTLAQVHAASANEPVVDSARSIKVLPLGMFDVNESDARKIEARLPISFFHGDCWHGNVLVNSNLDCVLIDPIQSPWLFGKERFDRASGIVDLATLHMSLLVSMKIMPLLRIDVDKQLALGELLLDSYLQQFDANSLRNQVLKLSNSIAIKYVSSYPVRINYLVGWVKIWLSRRVIATAAKGLN